MIITSTAFRNNETIPALYTCDGKNVHPPLSIHDIPAGAVSLALVVLDPDSIRGAWTHWIVWNINPNTTEIPEGALVGTEGVTDFGSVGYGGPCPRSGIHRYAFTLFALETMLDLPPSADRAAFERAIEEHILARATLTGTYRRT